VAKKQQYKYNADSLSYEEVRVSFGRRVLRAVLFIAPSLVFGLALSLLFTRQIDSPNENRLLADLNLNEIEVERMRENIKLYNAVLDVIEGRDEDLYRNILYADKFPEELRRMGTGGSDKYAHLKGVKNGDLLQAASVEMDQLERRLHGQSMSFRELLKLVKNKEKMITCIPSIQPVRNSDLRRAISGFGWRVDPIYKTQHMHTGMDFTAKQGTEVYATGDGVIEDIENNAWGYGRSIIINHGYGYKTRYAHLSAFKVKKGDKVSRGQLVGLVGSTGRSTGPHLHYEVEKNGTKVNPIGYYHSDLTPEQYEQLLEASKNSHKALD
jgi:murein DD-endopeptidase MepM/ murein hydrolase activator NlpD